jgi:8-oxo-dGTP diphosphatase
VGDRAGAQGIGSADDLPEPADALVRVVAAVIRRGDRFLVCQRPPHKRHGGLWEFPGGKCEPGETDADAIRRELQEELGMELVGTGPPIFETRDPGSRFLIVFVPAIASGRPQPYEHSDLRWGTVSEIADLPLAPSDGSLVAFLVGRR